MSIASPDLQQLYDRYAPTVFRQAFRLIGRESDAWDAVHDVFLDLLEEEDGFRGDSQLLTFLFRAVTNRCLNVMRATGVRTRGHLTLQVTQAQSALPPESRSHARDFVLQLSRELDGRHRALEVAVYKYVDEMTQEEIAATMGVSRKTVQRDLETLGLIAQRLVAASGEA